MKLALGTAQFGIPYGISNRNGIVNRDEVKKIIYNSYRVGIDTIDTAKNYGNCEELLGEIGVKKFKVITKLSNLNKKNIDLKSWILENILESLKKLKLDTLYAVLIHDPDFSKNSNYKYIFEELEKFKNKGNIIKIGVSVYNPEELEDIINNFNIDIAQIPLNLVDRRFEKVGLLNKLQNKKIEIHSRSTFLQGLLLTKSSEISEYFTNWLEIFEDFEEWTEKKMISKINACLNYPISLNSISKIIIAVDSFNQFSEITNLYKKTEINSYPDLSFHEIGLIDPRNWPKS